MRSVEKFNFALGNRFSTYATYAIQRHFFRISHKGRQYRNRFASDDEPVKDRAEEVSDHEACSPDQVKFLKTLFSKFLDSLDSMEISQKHFVNSEQKWESARKEFARFRLGQ